MKTVYGSASSPLNLSFTSSATGRPDLWADAPESDSWADGNAEGARRADELFDHIARHQQPSLLGHVVGAIMERRAGRDFGAIECGFFSRIASRSMTRKPAESASRSMTRKPGESATILPFVLNREAESSGIVAH